MEKGGRIGYRLFSFLQYDVFFVLEVLAQLFFSTTVITNLFFRKDLINEQDLEVYLTDSFVHLTATINLKKERKIDSPDISDSP